jgi:hypothetical protein
MGARVRTIDLLALAALACYGVAVLPYVPSVAAQVAGTVLCFVVTGIALALAILPADASSGARYTAVAACALSAGVVGGMVLNPFPSGLNQFGWLTFALATSLVACGVARVRGVGAPVHWKRPEFRSFSWASSAKVLASVVLVGAAIGISLVSENAKEKPFTELWLVPDAPGQSPWGATRAELGIKSHEPTTEDFTVVVDTSRQIMTTRITLAPNQVWTQLVPVEGKNASAEVYRGGVMGQPYRAVWLVTR